MRLPAGRSNLFPCLARSPGCIVCSAQAVLTPKTPTIPKTTPTTPLWFGSATLWPGISISGRLRSSLSWCSLVTWVELCMGPHNYRRVCRGPSCLRRTPTLLSSMIGKTCISASFPTGSR
uniref:Uncharacterized protein n=1 Tax=Cacopsylla melanoneura TaxID=428564 RepID=A0A8D8XB55_9HEMI